MKKTAFILSGALFYIVLSIILSSYGNVHSHQKLNGAIVDVFDSRYETVSDKKDKFYNYTFPFKSTAAITGEKIRIGGKEYVTTGEDRLTVKEWIIHGGFSADEPQLPASYRHFYDPTEPRGERYLKDLLNEFYIRWIITNPKTDHIEWAIADEEHEYNYEAGKMAFESAIEEPDKETREEHLAFAWRALGETLHMIADMGIACHVRDDAHPAALGQNIDLFGGPDPYEEVCEVIAKNSGISDWLTGSVDPNVSSFSKSSERAITIAENLASYTNRNFFSNHTISGENIKPKAHPEKDYDSPKLEDCEYEKSSSLYMKNIGGNAVKMCKDLSYLNALNDFRGYPYVDKECAISQAKALAPQIVEAGVNVIRCFIPKLEVTITEVTADSIKGEVKHKVDLEYLVELKYNGLVSIKKNNLFSDLIDEIICEDGKFAAPIDYGDFDFAKDKLFAEINLGNLKIKSDPYEDPLFKYVTVVFSGIDGGDIIECTIGRIYDDGWSFSTNALEGQPPLQWKGRSFSSIFNTMRNDVNFALRFDGSLSSNRTLLEDLRIEWNMGNDVSSSHWLCDFINVPCKVNKESIESMIPDGQGKQYLQELVMDDTEPDRNSTIKQVFWSNMRISITLHNDDSKLPMAINNKMIYME